MKTGIIGLPQVGKTSLFKILTKAKLEERGYSNPREAHLGVAKVPDERLDKLAALYRTEEDRLCDGGICRRRRNRPGGAEGNGVPDSSAQCRCADPCAARL